MPHWKEPTMSTRDHGSLPLRDYDHLPLPSLAQRIRSLTADELAELLGYERAHANRLPAVQIFERRLAELAAGASPSSGQQQSGPDWPPPPAGGPKVTPQTAGPPAFPPPHGTTDQSGKPKADRDT
jgi:hypothetical protein